MSNLLVGFTASGLADPPVLLRERAAEHRCEESAHDG
jgi:hypothetical protein